MEKIKSPAVAGTFYNADKTALETQIKNFELNSKNSYEYKSRAVIVPHAGLIFSGQLAFEGIQSLRRDLKTLIIFAPAHRVPVRNLALTTYKYWQTPLGNIKINSELNNEIKSNFKANYNDEALEFEHSIEIELPIIQYQFKNIEIVPILTGSEDYEEISKIIDYFWKNEDVGFVISSDLSHYLQDEEAKRIDNITANMIEDKNIDDFVQQQACGRCGIKGLVNFANENDFSLIRIGLINSSSANADKSRVVGYGSWFLYNGEKNKFLKEYYSKEMINICKNTIKSSFTDVFLNLTLPAVFEQQTACFVTLNKNNRLRGCIGSIIAHRSLINDLIHNSKSSAFADNRFNPVSKDEVEQLEIAISLLSAPKKINFKDEEDFMSQIKENIDGIVIRDGNKQAVYLPCVWEQLPDKYDFIKNLKLKAGMAPNHFSKTFQAFKFNTEYIK